MQAKRNSHLDGCNHRRHMNVISNKTKQFNKTELKVLNYSLLLLPTRSIAISQCKEIKRKLCMRSFSAIEFQMNSKNAVIPIHQDMSHPMRPLRVITFYFYCCTCTITIYNKLNKSSTYSVRGEKKERKTERKPTDTCRNRTAEGQKTCNLFQPLATSI